MFMDVTDPSVSSSRLDELTKIYHVNDLPHPLILPSF